MRNKIVLLLSLLGVSFFSMAQNVDVEKVSKVHENKPLALNGGLSTGSVFYSGNQSSGRKDWTYYVNGNLNLNIYELVNIPISINVTNLGSDLSYPSLPNRFSLHPTYKWATAHIGDVSMTFSPYTLSGHQFTGGGVELTPGNKFKVSAMGGRLLKQVKYDENEPYIMPNYKRMGYGIKTEYNAKTFSIGLIYFGAQDKEDDRIAYASDSLGVTPYNNNVISVNTTLNVVQNLSLSVEYALSLLTRDSRSPREGSSVIDKILNRKSSTSSYHAINARINYQLKKNTIGFGYERIDPEYRTLGAYYFNNDYENFTVNFARPFLKDDKANVAVSFGVQRDDLDDTKEESSNRYVASVNLNYNPTEDLQTSLNFSTFQSHRNLKSQFDYINEVNPYDNMDTLRFTQLSLNLDGSVMYTFKKTEVQIQRVNLNVSYQESADKQGGISLPGNVSRFMNAVVGHGIQFIPQGLSITSSINGSYNYGGAIESYTVGPMIGVTKTFLKKTLTTGLSSSYNMNFNAGVARAKVFNCRANATYRLLKRHNFNANIVWQNREIKDKTTTNAVTTTVGYAYNF